MNVCNEIRRSHKHQHRDDECTYIQQDPPPEAKLHRHTIHIISDRVELEGTKPRLHSDKSQADEVSPQHATTDQEHRETQENLTDGKVVRTECLQYANHVGALQNDDEQARNHGESSHPRHENEDDPHVHVEQVEPSEDLRIAFLYRLRVISRSIGILHHVQLLTEHEARFLQAVVVGHLHFDTTCLVCLPSIQTVDGIKVGQQKDIIVDSKVGLIDTRYLQSTGTDIVARDIISIELVAQFQMKFIGNGTRDERAVGRSRIAEGRYLPLLQMLAEEGPVILAFSPK